MDASYFISVIFIWSTAHQHLSINYYNVLLSLLSGVLSADLCSESSSLNSYWSPFKKIITFCICCIRLGMSSLSCQDRIWVRQTLISLESSWEHLLLSLTGLFASSLHNQPLLISRITAALRKEYCWDKMQPNLIALSFRIPFYPTPYARCNNWHYFCQLPSNKIPDPNQAMNHLASNVQELLHEKYKPMSRCTI